MCRDRAYIFVALYSGIDPCLIRVFLLPRAVNQFDLNDIPDVLVQLAPTSALVRKRTERKGNVEQVFSHDKIYIKEIIEDPAF